MTNVASGAIKLIALGMLGFAGNNALAQSIDLTGPTPDPAAGATDVPLLIGYTPGNNLTTLGFTVTEADPGSITSNIRFQRFNLATNAFVDCDGSEAAAVLNQATFTPVLVQCTAAGFYQVRDGAGTNPLPAIPNPPGAIGRALFDLSAGSAGQSVTFSIGANCTAGQQASTTGCTQYADNTGTPFNGPVTTETVTVAAAAPVIPVLTFNPTAGTTVNLTGAGTEIGDTANASIAVTANSPAGANTNATVTSCAYSGAGAGAFGAPPANLSLAAGGNGSLSLSCTRAATAQNATLTCNKSDGAAGATVSWPVVCPLGTEPPVTPVAPTVSGSTPAVGGNITISGGPVGQSASGSLVFTTTGGAGTGTTTVACTSNNAAVTVTPANRVIGVGATAAQRTFTVSVVLGASAQNFANAVTCTVDGAAFGSFGVAAPGGTSFTPPEVIPSASTWSKIAMFGLLGLFGMMAVGFRRQG